MASNCVMVSVAGNGDSLHFISLTGKHVDGRMIESGKKMNTKESFSSKVSSKSFIKKIQLLWVSVNQFYNININTLRPIIAKSEENLMRDLVKGIEAKCRLSQK